MGLLSKATDFLRYGNKTKVPLIKGKEITPDMAKRIKTTDKIVSGVLGTAGLVALNPSLALRVGTAVGKSLVPKSVLGKVAGIGATLWGGKLLMESPKAREKTKDVITKAPKEFFGSATDVAGFIEAPSSTSAKEIVTNNPIISSVVGATALGLAGMGVAKWVPSIFLGSKISDLEEEIGDLGTLPSATPQETGGAIVESPSPTLPKEKAISTEDAPLPTTQTETITTGTTTKKRRTCKRAKKQPSINIKIDNRDNYTSRKIYKHKKHHKC